MQACVETGEIYDMKPVLAAIESSKMMQLYELKNRATSQELDELGVF
jgi:hypothetical protein